MAVYRVYDLNLRSELELPALPRAEGRPDAMLRLGSVRARTEAVPKGPGCFAIDARRIFLYYPKAGAILVQDGREIVVEPAEEGDRGFLRTLLLGQGLGLLLHQRGLLTLHASAVAFGGQAVAFLGGKGYGKSTTAAALARRGRPLVTDDVLALRFSQRGDGPMAVPGPASMKLRPDAAASVTAAPGRLSALYELTEKRVWTPDVVYQEPLPLRALYVLGWRIEPTARRLAPRDALRAVLSHTYTGQAARPTGTAPVQLRQCTALVRGVPVYRLERPDALEGLDASVQFVEQHVGSLSSASSPSPCASGAHAPVDVTHMLRAADVSIIR